MLNGYENPNDSIFSPLPNLGAVTISEGEGGPEGGGGTGTGGSWDD